MTFLGRLKIHRAVCPDREISFNGNVHITSYTNIKVATNSHLSGASDLDICVRSAVNANVASDCYSTFTVNGNISIPVDNSVPISDDFAYFCTICINLLESTRSVICMNAFISRSIIKFLHMTGFSLHYFIIWILSTIWHLWLAKVTLVKCHRNINSSLRILKHDNGFFSNATC